MACKNCECRDETPVSWFNEADEFNSNKSSYYGPEPVLDTVSPIFSQRLLKYLPSMMLELETYIERTYGQHYASEDNLQTIDAWDASGSLVTTARDTARKYLDRYGKKKGNNPDDLLKALHYTLMMYFKNHVDL